MASRYENSDVIINNSTMYSSIFEDRGVKRIEHFGTRNLKFPNQEQLTELEIISHVWKYGDRYYRLADQNYGDPSLWWVIAFFNQAPTEASLEFGKVIFIPHPLERVLSIYGA